jgi:S-adenosylmethionine hydrolase
MIFLFTDFGSADIYVGQVKSVLAASAPEIPVIDLLHDAPPFNVRAGAHLLAALATRMCIGDVAIAVVDPGVGGERDAVAICAGGRWFVAPDNGLASVAAARCESPDFFSIGWRPDALSASFHGRDLFAPVAAMLARGDRAGPRLRSKSALDTDLGGGDLAEIVYLDHYGNAMTGLRAGSIARDVRLGVAGCGIAHAPVFSAVPAAEPFWYENSLGLVEIAANATSAARELGLVVGQRVEMGA